MTHAALGGLLVLVGCLIGFFAIADRADQEEKKPEREEKKRDLWGGWKWR